MKSFKMNPVSNRHVVAAEREGFGEDFYQKHLTSIADPSIRAQIMRMSVLEVIS